MDAKDLPFVLLQSSIEHAPLNWRLNETDRLVVRPNGQKEKRFATLVCSGAFAPEPVLPACTSERKAASINTYDPG
jgi:hypothetical protein